MFSVFPGKNDFVKEKIPRILGKIKKSPGKTLVKNIFSGYSLTAQHSNANTRQDKEGN